MISRRARSRIVLLLAALLTGALMITCAGSKGRQNWSRKWGPLVPHKSFPGDCGLCHLTDGWDTLRKDFSFDHAKQAGVALKGAHEEAACLRCHNDFGPVKAYVERGCNGCHADIHRDQLGSCTRCHNEISWRPTGLIAEHARTRFPLVGRHAIVACTLCHIRAPTGDFSGAPVRCEQCHARDLARAISPDHSAQGWTNNCQRCHNPTTWGAGGFVHAFFPLSGAHASANCTACHTGGDFTTRLPRDCLSCHTDDRARAPNHDSLPTNCEQCHNTASWEGVTFAHTRFPLTGAHLSANCTACHTGGNFTTPLPRDCLSCHTDDRARAPNHQSFPTDCQTCHNTTTWKGATFNHRFELRGRHDVDCSVCHTGNNTSIVNCLGCHTPNETNKDHDEVRGYTYASAACVRCHPAGKD